MRTGLSQQTGLRQELRINPRLYQAMDMLYMPMMDLQQHLKQELLANPFLELLEPEERRSKGSPKRRRKRRRKSEKEEEIDWEEILLNGFDAGGMRQQYEEQEYIEPVCVETKDLIDHLREQLQMMTLTPRQLLLSEEFLGNINDEGYLAAPLEEIRARSTCWSSGPRRRPRRPRTRERRRPMAENDGCEPEPRGGAADPGPPRPTARPTTRGRAGGDARGDPEAGPARASAPATCANASCSSSAKPGTPIRSRTGWCRRPSPT